MMRVLVCGGRDYEYRSLLYAFMDKLHAETPIDVIISGCSRGADTLAINWAGERGVAVEKFPADWKTYGRAAGPLRNKQMLDEGKPNLVVAFPGGAGTAHMVRHSEQVGVPVIFPANQEAAA